MNHICIFRYRAFRDAPSQRSSAEDLAFSVANFFAKNGTFVSLSTITWYYIYTYMLTTFVLYYFYITSISDEYWCSTMVVQMMVVHIFTLEL